VTAVALEQRDTQLVFEPPDLLAEGWLGDVQSLRSAAEVELLGRGDEVLNEAEVQPFDRSSLLMRWQLVFDFGLLGPHASRANAHATDDREAPDGSREREVRDARDPVGNRSSGCSWSPTRSSGSS